VLKGRPSQYPADWSGGDFILLRSDPSFDVQRNGGEHVPGLTDRGGMGTFGRDSHGLTEPQDDIQSPVEDMFRCFSPTVTLAELMPAPHSLSTFAATQSPDQMGLPPIDSGMIDGLPLMSVRHDSLYIS
jgi:hypothetical protein